MENNTSEQEQLDELRKWWNANGNAILFGLALGLTGLFGYRYWQSMQEANAESASTNYQHFLQIASAGPSDEARTTGKAILDGYPDSAYARLTALLLARMAVEDQKIADARQHLQWVIEHGPDSELAGVARGRLAQLLLAEGKADEAWAEISKVKEAAGEEPLFAEIRGDILAAQGKREDAFKMYAQAITTVAAVGGDASHLELKRDSLGVDPATAN